MDSDIIRLGAIGGGGLRLVALQQFTQVPGVVFGDGQTNSPLYPRLLRSLLYELAAWIRDRIHRRVVTEVIGPHSLTTACEADALAFRAEDGR